MSQPENQQVPKTPSVKKVREFFRKSLTFSKFPSLLSLQTSECRDNITRESSLERSRVSVEDVDHELHELHVHLAQLRQDISDIKEKNEEDLKAMTTVLKRGMERLDQLGDQLDDFDQNAQIDKENIQIQMEEMEAKIHHQIRDQYGDLQEAIERLYLRMDTLEKKYHERRQQMELEEKETSYARSIVVKIVNFFLCVAQVILVIVNTISETLHPLTNNVANIAFICGALYLAAVLNDEEVRKATQRFLKRAFSTLFVFK